MAKLRTPLISGNWKMNHNHLEALHTVEKLHFRLHKDDYAFADVSVHPPFTDLRTVQTYLAGEKKAMLLLGAQNCHTEAKGAFTGEVSPAMLAKLEVKYVIVGHSERRQMFGETDEVVNAKAKAVLANGMTPIVCCGETLEQRDSGEATALVCAQIVAGLAGMKPEVVGALVIAYEPIWAIGTGVTATSDDAQQMCAAIRAQVSETFGAEAAMRVRIQYGGSAKANNAVELLSQPDIDGLLVGGASLDPDEFSKIIQCAQEASRAS
jgi:triosephosphate isomerase (TIM)